MTSLGRNASLGRLARLSGVPFYVAAILTGSLMDAVIKHLARDYPISEIVFFRSLFGLLPIAIPLLMQNSVRSLATRHLGAHALRGMISAVAALTFFFAFGSMSLADAYAFAFTAPLFMVALGAPLLGETARPSQWVAVVGGFVGVLIVLRPGPGFVETLLSWPAAAALGGTFLYAVAMVLTRKLSRTETNEAIVVYGTAVTVLVTLPFLLIDGRMPGPADLAWLVLTGLLGGGTLILLTEAFRRSAVAILAPFEYTAMLWALILGYLFWDDRPTVWLALGAVVIIGCGRLATRPAPFAN
jgi:drug/metabolite transporter (DMT)-like permease